MAQDIFGIPNITVTDDLYWDHQPAPVRALRHMGNGTDDTIAAAKALALQGYLIDVPLMVWHWPVPNTMALRMLDGYTWVPSALMAPITSPPGYSAGPHSVAYDPTKPPPGAIMVSIDAKDFPMAQDLVDAANAVVIMTARKVGPYLFTDASGNDIYANGAAESGSTLDATVTQDGKTYTLVNVIGPFGFSIPHYKLNR